MKPRLFSLMSLVLAVGMSLLLIGVPLAQAERQIPVAVNPALRADVGALVTYTAYIPLVFGPGPACGTGQSYSQGPVYQYDTDTTVRPAYNHADKNFALRGYTADNGQTKALAAITGPTDTKAPQLNTLVSPQRKFTITSTRSSYEWNWGTPPNPGTKGSVITNPAVTVVGLQVSVGETIRVPTSGYDLGASITAIVLYAASNRITLHYTRDDSGYPGYTIHIDNICVDPNLLSLYNSLDGTARNTYYGPPFGCCTPDYNLVTLTSNQPVGRATSTELIVAIRDTGAFMDPRSCKDWWKAYWNGSTSSPVCL